MLTDIDNRIISVSRQTSLLGLSRSSMYYHPVIDEYNLILMKRIDEIHTKIPFYGQPKITFLLQQEGHLVNHKRIERLMRLMGITALQPKIHLTQRNKDHKIYPYLLRGMNIDKCDQVWATDITYIRMKNDFVYLVALMDWHSRYVLSWELSASMDVSFCLQILERALKKNKPEVHNSDQGSQFTSHDYIQILKNHEIKISMDGRGRAFDNIFIERLWRSVKYEEIYLKEYETITEARQELSEYFIFYNKTRIHQSLDYKTPAQIYFKNKRNKIRN
jgi:putative transposase